MKQAVEQRQGHVNRRLTFRRAFGMGVFILNCCVLVVLGLVLFCALTLDGFGSTPVFVPVGLGIFVALLSLYALFRGIKDRPRRWLSKIVGLCCLFPGVYILFGLFVAWTVGFDSSIPFDLSPRRAKIAVLAMAPYYLTAWSLFLLRTRLSPTQCLNCAYDTTGVVSDMCPECGLNASAYEAQRTWLGRSTCIGGAMVLSVFGVLCWAVNEVASVYGDHSVIDTASREALLDLCVSEQPQGVNGWVHFEALSEEARSLFHRVDDSLWTEAEDSDALELAINSAVIEMIEEARLFERMREALKADAFIPSGDESSQHSFGGFFRSSGGRSFVQFLVPMVEADLERSDWTMAIERWRVMIRIGEIIGVQPDPSDPMCAAWILNDLLQSMQHALMNDDVPNAVVAEIDAMVSTMRVPVHEDFIERARLVSIEYLHWRYGAGGYALPWDEFFFGIPVKHVYDYDFSYANRSLREAVRSRFRMATLDESIDLTDRWYDALSKALAAPVSTRWQFWRIVALDAEVNSERFGVVRDAIYDNDPWFPVTDLLHARLDIVRMLIALTRYQDAYGELPQTLDELVPEYLDAVPSDAASGGAFVYARGPEGGGLSGATLYSTGPDGVDDGGRFIELEDWEYLEPLLIAPGYDFNLLGAW